MVRPRSRRVACPGGRLIAGWTLVVLLTTVAGSLPASAGGARLYETSAGDVALAAAGYVARAQDASTVFSNPAGMCMLEPGNEYLVSLQPLYGDVGFSPSAETTVDGSDGGNAIGLFPGLSAFYAGGNERVKWGLGVVGNFGLGLDYEEEWVGRYYVQDTTLIGMTLAPSVAYRINDKFAIGASLHAMYGVFDLTTAVNNVGPMAGDGGLKFDETTWGYGGRVGLLFEPSESTRIGLVYQSEISLDFKGAPEYSDLGPVREALLDAAGLLDADSTCR